MIDQHEPRREYALQLADGRQLGVAEFGTAGGLPVLWFHGTPGARRQVPYSAREYALSNNLRIICVERPGIGLSTPHLYPNVDAWGSDMEEFADRLALDRFGLVGLSGGGPYVLATAHHMPQRVIAGTVFGGVAPTLGNEAQEGGLTRMAIPAERTLSFMKKPLGRLVSWTIRSLHPLKDPIFDAVVKYGPATESAVLGQPEFREMFVDDLLRGTKTGMHSVLYDIILFARPWGFDVSNIRVPLHFWQGTADPIVPVHHAQAMVDLIPGAGITICDEEGHLAGLDRCTDALAFIASKQLAEGVGARPASQKKNRKKTP